MLQIYPTYEGLVSYWSAGKIGSVKTLSLPQETYTNVFPEPFPSPIDGLSTSFFKDAGIYSSSLMRNARLFSSGLNLTPLQSTGLSTTNTIPIYTPSTKNIMEGYVVRFSTDSADTPRSLIKEYVPPVE